MRTRGVVLLGAGLTYLTGSILLPFAASGSRPGLRFAGFALMVAAYGVSALALLQPKDKSVTLWELALLLGFGILFRLALLAGSPWDLGSSLGFPAPEPPGLMPRPPGMPPQPPLGVALSVWILGVRAEAWIGYLFLALCELGTWAVLLMMLEASRESSAWLLLYVWNPLAALAGATGALSCAAGFLLVLALWFFSRGLSGRGVALLGSAAAGSYALFPALVAVVAGPLRRTLAGPVRRKLVGAATVAAVVASGGLVALLWPSWREAFSQALRQGSQNAGPFALVQWLTGSRLAAWAAAGATCALVAVAFRRKQPLSVLSGTLKAAVLSAPVVLAGGLYVLTPVLVFRPSVAWAGFTCAVLLLQVGRPLCGHPGEPVPWSWLIVEYGGLALALVAEWVVGWRVKRAGGPPASPAAGAGAAVKSDEKRAY